ncbi:MAG: radical SAM protein [Treponemataceae bacterium]
MYDSFGREIRYLRISVTDRCNLRCVYCMPAEGVASIPHEKIISYERIVAVAAAAAKLGFVKFRITGGEPLVRKNLPHLVSLLSEIPGPHSIGMTTNGTLLAPVAHELKFRGLGSVNVSLDTLSPDRYAELTRGGRLREALEGIREARSAGLPVKLNVVMTDERSEDDLQKIRLYAEAVGAKVQTIARYRLDEKKEDGGSFDRPPPCASCDRLRLLADGTLRPCLHGSAGIPVDFADIEGSIAAAVNAKPACGLACRETAVCGIGG